jgi:hypothetical protein
MTPLSGPEEAILSSVLMEKAVTSRVLRAIPPRIERLVAEL